MHPRNIPHTQPHRRDHRSATFIKLLALLVILALALTRYAPPVRATGGMGDFSVAQSWDSGACVTSNVHLRSEVQGWASDQSNPGVAGAWDMYHVEVYDGNGQLIQSGEGRAAQGETAVITPVEFHGWPGHTPVSARPVTVIYYDGQPANGYKEVEIARYTFDPAEYISSCAALPVGTTEPPPPPTQPPQTPVATETPARPTFTINGRQVWVMYLAFWGGPLTWDWQTDVLTDTSLLGKYDSRDESVIRTHIRQAQDTGIDAFTVAWFGLDDQVTTTPTIPLMLDEAQRQGFKIGVVVDIWDPNFNQNPDRVIESMHYLVREWTTHPAYLHYNGQPVILFAFQNHLGLDAAQWQSVRAQVDPQRQMVWVSEGLLGCCVYGGAMDGMYAFNMAWADGSAARYEYERSRVEANGGTVYFPTIHPGWDETKVAIRDKRPNPTSARSRRDGAFLETLWYGATSINPDVVMVVSWNEFIEGSHIEPSQRFGTQALDVLQPLIDEWKLPLRLITPTPIPLPTPLATATPLSAASPLAVANTPTEVTPTSDAKFTEPGDPSQVNAAGSAPGDDDAQPSGPDLSPDDWQTIAIVGLCVVGPGLLGVWLSARRRPNEEKDSPLI